MTEFINRSKNLILSNIKTAYAALDIRDLFLIVGLAMLGYGLYLLRPWLGFSVPGAIMILLSLFVGKRDK